MEDKETDTYDLNMSKISILTQNDGSVLVIASEPLTQVCVYGIDGSLQQEFAPNSQSQTLHLGQAIFIVQARTQRENKVQKVTMK